MATHYPTIGQNSRRAAIGRARPQQTQATDALGRCLKGIDFPQSKSDIVAYAYAHGASHGIIHALEGLPERIFENLTELRAELDRGPAESPG
jgi:hypothetical protein